MRAAGYILINKILHNASEKQRGANTAWSAPPTYVTQSLPHNEPPDQVDGRNQVTQLLAAVWTDHRSIRTVSRCRLRLSLLAPPRASPPSSLAVHPDYWLSSGHALSPRSHHDPLASTLLRLDLADGKHVAPTSLFYTATGATSIDRPASPAVGSSARRSKKIKTANGTRSASIFVAGPFTIRTHYFSSATSSFEIRTIKQLI